ncbi:MAG: hypothetical protein L3K23_02680 [Thermoplasmata archaeon]|nr:hypothetical protein [Thermoplasmata archaeon]
MEERSHSSALPPLVATQDGPLVTKVLGELPSDALPLLGTTFLQASDRTKIDSDAFTVRGREVGGVEVQVDTDGSDRRLDRTGNSKVEEKGARAKGQTESPVRRLPISPEEGVLKPGKIDVNVSAPSDRHVQATQNGIPPEQPRVKARLQTATAGDRVVQSHEALG